MRKTAIGLFGVLVILLSLCGCSTVQLDPEAAVTLTFIYGDAHVEATLTDSEAATVIAALNGKRYQSPLDGVPSCGFDGNVSLSVGGRRFAVACDTCNIVQDLGNLQFFTIPKEDMEQIHALFEAYGGHFPCV